MPTADEPAYRAIARSDNELLIRGFVDVLSCRDVLGLVPVLAPARSLPRHLGFESRVDATLF